MSVVRKVTTVGISTLLAGASVLASAGTASAATTPTTGPTTTAPAPTVKPAGCGTGELPVTVIGNPQVKAQQTAGVYLWHGKDGYAMRVTHPGKTKMVFAGSITVSRDISAIHRVTLEKGDTVKVGPHRHTLTFRFTNYGGIDGVNFAAECSKTLHVTLSIDKTTAAPEQVFLGANRTHPTSVPFTLTRTPEPAVAPTPAP